MSTVAEPLAPPFAYYGGKTRIAGWITRHLPAHGHYVEPYAGGLSVLLAKAPSPHETVNDLDGDLMAFWRVLRDRPAELARACALTPHSRAEFAAARDLPGVADELERARRVWVILSQGRAGRLSPNRSGWHTTRTNTSTGNGGTARGRVEVLLSNRPLPMTQPDLFGDTG